MTRLWRIAAIGILVAALLLSGPVRSTVAAGEFAAGDTAIVVTTEGDLLALREGPGIDYQALTAFAAGTRLTVLDGPLVGDEGLSWYRVSDGALSGWSAATWLAADDGTVAAPSSTRQPVEGTTLIVSAVGGANLREQPTLASEVILLIPQGATMKVRSAPVSADGYDWLLVRYGDISGWAASILLGGATATSGGTSGGTSASTPAPATASAGGAITIGASVQVSGTDGYDLRIREGIGVAAPLFTTVPEGTILTIVNSPLADSGGAVWYGVSTGSEYGWALGLYLTPAQSTATRTLADTQRLASLSVTRPLVSQPRRGRAIVAEALTHLDVPYVWGGSTPANGWDCSGMVQWLYRTIWGLSLPRVTEDQWLVGTPVPRSQIEAGDIVFFYDTFGPGITHNGIALGDGRFIQARDTPYGTVISSLDEQRYIDHYAGARRP